MVYFIEHPIKTDDFRLPLFQEISICCLIVVDIDFVVFAGDRMNIALDVYLISNMC